MYLRSAAPIVGVCALAFVTCSSPESSSGEPISVRDGRANVTRIVVVHAEAVDHILISALITGEVTSVEVHSNEHVSRGQVLFRIDDRPYQLAVEVAQANLAIAQHHIVALKAIYRQHLAGLAIARDVVAYQQRMHDKQAQQLSRGVISQVEFDQTTVALLDARKTVLAEQCAIAETLADLDNHPDLPTNHHPFVERAEAELGRAELDLSHIVVTAPVDGIVTNVDHLRVVEFLQVGTAVFDLVPEKISN